MTGYVSKKMLGAARLPDTPSARAYLDRVLDDDDTHKSGQPDLTDADRKTYQAGHNAGVAHHKQATKREWVSLTDDQIKEIVGPWGDTPIKGYTRKLIDQIDAKLKEMNT